MFLSKMASRMLLQCARRNNFCTVEFMFLKKNISRNFSFLSLVNKNSNSFTRDVCLRRFHTDEQRRKNKNSVFYLTALVLLVGGFTYLSEILYRIYCQSKGSGQAVINELSEKVAKMEKNKDRLITVSFNADVNSQLLWNFKPSQTEIKVSPGETALAFYTAKNPSDRPISGIATYNVLPFEAGKYFNKIQCFCFEEQLLNPNEEVDMPVFFYLDPEYSLDAKLEIVNNIILSYTFFEAKEGLDIPRPEYV